MTTARNTARPNKPSQEVAVERNLTEIEQLDTLLAQRLGGDLNGYRDLLTDTTVTGAWAQRQTAMPRQPKLWLLWRKQPTSRPPNLLPRNCSGSTLTRC